MTAALKFGNTWSAACWTHVYTHPPSSRDRVTSQKERPLEIGDQNLGDMSEAWNKSLWTKNYILDHFCLFFLPDLTYWLFFLSTHKFLHYFFLSTVSLTIFTFSSITWITSFVKFSSVDFFCCSIISFKFTLSSSFSIFHCSRSGCSSYRGISLLSIPGKVYRRILTERLMEVTEGKVSEDQGGFRKGRGCVD